MFTAAMSSLDSILNSTTATFVRDIYEPYVAKGKKASLNWDWKPLMTMIVSSYYTVPLVIFNTIILVVKKVRAKRADV